MKVEGCEYPESLLYDVEAGTWAREEGARFRIGVAPHLGWISGGFTSVSFKGVGSRIDAGKGLGAVEGPKHFDVVRAPFDSVILEVNGRLMAEPKLANRDPYGEGWFVIIERVGVSTSLRPFAESAHAINEAVRRLGVHCFSAFPDQEMFEIGVECSAVLVKLNEQLEKTSPGTVFHLVSDDPTSDIEMERWALQTGNEVLESRRAGDLHHFIVRKR